MNEPKQDVTVVCVDKFVHSLPAYYGQANCECMHCKTKRVNNSRNVINHGPYKPAGQLGENEINRVALPGDPDYKGVTKHAFPREGVGRRMDSGSE